MRFAQPINEPIVDTFFLSLLDEIYSALSLPLRREPEEIHTFLLATRQFSIL